LDALFFKDNFRAAIYFWNQKKNQYLCYMEQLDSDNSKFSEHPGRLSDPLFIGKVWGNSTFLEPEKQYL
jgi:hypothetical protein